MKYYKLKSGQNLTQLSCVPHNYFQKAEKQGEKELQKKKQPQQQHQQTHNPQQQQMIQFQHNEEAQLFLKALLT